MPSIIQLEYIVAVADHRHFGKASQACHISQPTLSQQIQKAEQLLGIIIFDRIKKPVVPTPEGEQLLVQARAILREHRRMCETARSSTTEIAGTFHMAMIPTISSSLVPLFIEHFSKNHPKVELFIE